MAPERYTTKSGETRFRVRYYEAGRGSRRRSKSFPLKRDAEMWERERKRRRDLGDLASLDAGSQTLEQLAGDWFNRYAIPNLERRTLSDYTKVLDAHIIPRLGNVRLRELSIETVETFRSDLERAGVGRSTVRRSLVVLQGILRRGVEWGRIQRNPVPAVRKPSGKRERAIVPPTPASIEAIREAILVRGRVGDATLVSVLAYTGVRPEEALALEWRHIRDRTLLVEQRNVDGQILAGQKAKRPPRTIDLIAPLKSDLAEWRLACGRPDDRALVFPNFRGEPWRLHDYGNWTRRTWNPAARLIDPKPTPYALRHSFASLLIREGQSIVEIAAQLGHSPQMTLNTYGHVFAELKGAARITAEEQVLEARRPSVAHRDGTAG